MENTYQGTALDPAMFEGQSTDSSTNQTDASTDASSVAPETNTSGSNTPNVDTAPSTETNQVEKINIPGMGEFTVDELKEFRQGGLRQSDYTKKTQDLARQREELKNAEELFNYLKANPYLVDAMKAAEREGNINSNYQPYIPTSNDALLQDVLWKQKSLEADMKMNELRSKYKDVDDVAIYKKAAELGTDDFEFIYKALHFDSNSNSILEQAKSEIKAELEKNRGAVSTMVNASRASHADVSTMLSEEEKKVALAMGMTEAEYLQWK